MGVQEECRRCPRIPLRLPVLCRWNGIAGVYYSFNLSESGVGVISSRPMSPGQLIELRLTHPLLQHTLHMKGKAIWNLFFSESDNLYFSRIGIQFLKVPEDAGLILSDLLDRFPES